MSGRVREGGAEFWAESAAGRRRAAVAQKLERKSVEWVANEQTQIATAAGVWRLTVQVGNAQWTRMVDQVEQVQWSERWMRQNFDVEQACY